LSTTAELLGQSERLQQNYDIALGDRHLVDALMRASDDCIKLLTLEGRLEMMSPGGLRVMEIDNFCALEGCEWLSFWTGDHFEDAERAVKDAQAGRYGHFSGYANTAKGNRRFWDVKVWPVKNDAGDVSALLSISRDMTAANEMQEKRQEVINEMRHRAKNALTIVQAIASQTLKAGGQELSPVSRTFAQRLQALARSYDALTLKDWSAADLRELVDLTTRPFEDSQSPRITIDGPAVEIPASHALALALAINELATNAAKYGALSNDTGRVSVSWNITDGRLRLNWQETGGPIMRTPEHRGFGSSLIDRALPGQMGGSVKITYAPEGVQCEFDAPIGTKEQR
jgi:two-component sensor histidine kinase